MRLTDEQRLGFDELLEEVLAALPDDLRGRFDEIPLVVEDRPTPSMLKKLDVGPGEFLCGVHSGIPLTRRSVEHSGVLPTVITIYREGILLAAQSRSGRIGERSLIRQIRKTVLHELGHHFGFEEEALKELGYE